MLLVDLPTEVLLQALSHLPIQDIHTFKAINRSCKDVVGENEGSIYHAAAILHGFVTESTSLQKATHNETWLNGVSNWKAFCRRHFALEARWKGQNILPKNGLKVGRSKTAGLNAHRLKIDEGEGTIIVSRAEGGLRVVSIDTDELLWELKASCRMVQRISRIHGAKEHYRDLEAIS
ncbi:hypothetical protein FRC02_009857 [Tulasnella sp. 418]|nr:hypothetical protein FRC02_009857 [Tulasnella sp. 418]